jgi:hypothetical protein
MKRTFGIWRVGFAAVLCAQCALWIYSYFSYEAILWQSPLRRHTLACTHFKFTSNCGALEIEKFSAISIVGAMWKSIGPVCLIIRKPERDWSPVFKNLWQLRCESQPPVYVGGRGGWIIHIPYALTAGITALPLIPWFRGRRLRRLHQRQGRCLACGYDLRASAGRCPECGETIAVGK